MKRSKILAVMIVAAVPAIAGAQTTARVAGKSEAKTARTAASAETKIAKTETKARTKAAKTADTPRSLRAEATITESAARDIALKQVAGGSVKASELEREKGRLVYSFDITVAGKTGIQEVLVDATNGTVVSTEHETPKMEKAEARKEAKEKAAAVKKK